MRKSLLAALAAVMVVSGCATVRESRLNPFNWFGRSERAAAVPAQPARDGGRIPVAQVTELFVEPASGGAIIRAKGVPPTQGWYSAELVREDGTREDEMIFRFVLKEPQEAVQGTPLSREVTVATFVTTQRLEAIRTITVTGTDNARSIRRR